MDLLQFDVVTPRICKSWTMYGGDIKDFCWDIGFLDCGVSKSGCSDRKNFLYVLQVDVQEDIEEGALSRVCF